MFYIVKVIITSITYIWKAVAIRKGHDHDLVWHMIWLVLLALNLKRCGHTLQTSRSLHRTSIVTPHRFIERRAPTRLLLHHLILLFRSPDLRAIQPYLYLTSYRYKHLQVKKKCNLYFFISDITSVFFVFTRLLGNFNVN